MVLPVKKMNMQKLYKEEQSSMTKNIKTIDAKKTAFFSTLLLGYMIHLFVFTNLIPNCDGLSRLYDRQNMLMSGRWFLHAASFFHGFTEAPALIGALSLIFLGLTAVLLTDLMKVKSLWGGALTGGFLVGNIALAYTYTFIFTASAYAFAILLAVAAVWATERYRRFGWIGGAVLLAFSLGIYQSYLAFALTLAVMIFILNLFDEEGKGGSIADRREKNRNSGNERTSERRSPASLFLRFVLLFGFGVGLYLLILKAAQRIAGTSLSDYRGMDSFGSKLSPAGIVGMARDVFTDACKYLFSNRIITLHGSYWVILNVVFLIVILYCILRLMRVHHFYRTPGKILWLLLALAFFPFALNFTSFLNHSSLWMRYSFTGYYLFAVALLERNFAGMNLKVKKTGAVSVILCILMLLFQSQYANAVYTALQTAHTATQSFLTVLTARIQSMPGYREDMNVIIIGTPSKELYQNGVPEFQLISTTASPANNVLYETKHIYYYLNDWLNVQWKEPSEKMFEKISDSREFREMPLYPNDGSIIISGNNVIVRLSEKYTPKASYELQFEKTQKQ